MSIQARVDAYINRVSLGAAKKNVKSVGEGVFEIKIDHGPPRSIGRIIVRRTTSYNEELSQRLRKPKYAQEFIAALMEGEEGLSAEDALRHTIQIMGVKEFAELAHVPAPNVVAFVKGRRNVKPETLDVLLKPFKLRTKLVFEKAS